MYRDATRISLRSDSSFLTSRRLQNGHASDKFHRFLALGYTANRDSATGYPYTLIAGSISNHFGSGTRSTRASRLKKSSPEAFVEISKPDAGRLHVGNGDRIRILSPVGELIVAARISDTVKEGILFMPISFPDSPATALFDLVFEPRSKTPALKVCAVKIERIDSHG